MKSTCSGCFCLLVKSKICCAVLLVFLMIQLNVNLFAFAHMAGSALFFFYNERVSKKALVLAGVAAGWGLRGLLEHQGLVGFQIRRT